MLTIAIPTWNRSSYLRELLDWLQIELTSQEEIRDNIEIIISDNNSSDDTELIAREFCRYNNNAKYYKNEFNLGPEKNFQQCIRLASSKYVWIIGDDDILYPNAINCIYNLLAKESPNLLIMLDALRVVDKYPVELKNKQRDYYKIYNNYGDFINYCFEESFGELIIAHTWLPSMVFKRKIINQKEFVRRNYSDYSYMYALMSNLDVPGRILLTYSSVLGLRDVRAAHILRNLKKKQLKYKVWLSCKYPCAVLIKSSMVQLINHYAIYNIGKIVQLFRR